MPSGSTRVLDEALHERGLRATPQRRLVLQAIGELGHATPEQVCDHVQSQAGAGRAASTLNLSTVYRALELMEELGVVSHTHLTHGSPTYQVADHVDHLHLVCRRCGSVTEADLDLARPLAAAVTLATGFRTDLAHLSLHGVCGDCAGEAERSGETGAAGETRETGEARREDSGPAER
jgi:Fur family ferric uptake transcriptional regulator